MKRWSRVVGLVVVAGALLGRGAAGQDDAKEDHGGGGDRVGVFQTITIDGKADDVACAFCTVVVDGKVQGDLAVLFGTVRLEDGSKVEGDVAALFSTLTFGDGTQVDGDLATALSTVQLSPTTMVRGDRAMFASRVGVTVFVGALLVVLGLLWLLIWGTRRLLAGR